MSKWDERYASGGYLFGTEPNGFLASRAHSIPYGPVLCIAEGEGRNAAWLAGRGYDVTAMDASSVGMTKARRLATAKGVRIETLVADLDDFDFGEGCWSGIVSTFGHLLPDLRRAVSRGIIGGLRPGGVVIIEAYTPDQLAFKTGGPSNPDLLVRAEMLGEDYRELELLHLAETEREVIEGELHIGRAHVVQLVGKKV